MLISIIKVPVLTGSSLLRIMEIPVTPPGAILLGSVKRLTPTAYTNAAAVIITYFFNFCMNMTPAFFCILLSYPFWEFYITPQRKLEKPIYLPAQAWADTHCP